MFKKINSSLLIALSASATVLLSACGGGGDNPAPQPSKAILNSSNYVEAMATGWVATKRHGLVLGTIGAGATFLNAADFQANFNCQKSGTLRVQTTGQSHLVVPDQCATDDGVAVSGGLAFVYSDTALKSDIILHDLIYVSSAERRNFKINGKVNMDASTSLSNISGSFSLEHDGRIDTYENIVQKSSGNNTSTPLVSLSMTIKAAKFVPSLNVLMDTSKEIFSVTAADGSVVNLSYLGNGLSKFELRGSAKSDLLESKVLGATEMQTVMSSVE